MHRRMVGGALVLAGALAVTACGSSSHNTSDTTAIPSSGSSGASGGTGASGGSGDVLKYLQRPTSINITTPVPQPLPKGKTLDWLQCGSPACTTLGSDLNQAAAAVGWKIVTIQAGLTPQSVQAAWNQAVINKPDAVLTSGFSRALFNPELAKLKADNIPVLDLTTADTPGNGLTAVFDYGPDYTASGKRLAEYVASQAGSSKINALTVTSSAFPNIGEVAHGFTGQLKVQCPSCKISTLDVPATSIGTDLPTRVASYLQGHPNINWVYIGYSDMMVGVPAALRAASIPNSVKFVTIDSSPATATYLKNKQYLVAMDGFPGPETMWREIDFLLRYFSHQPTTPDTAHTLPIWLLTPDNVPSTSDYFPLVTDYQAQYKKLWGVG